MNEYLILNEWMSIEINEKICGSEYLYDFSLVVVAITSLS